MLLVLIFSAVMGILYGIVNNDNSILEEGNFLERKAYGEGDYEQPLELMIEGYDEKFRYDVLVPEQRLSKKEEEQYLAAAVEEIFEEFPGENESINCIRKSVCIRESYQENRVAATWSFDDYKTVNLAGEVVAKELPEEGRLVRASVLLTCQDTMRQEEFYFRVFPVEKTAKEEIFWQIAQQIEEQAKTEEQAYLKLPENVENHQLAWQGQTDYTSEKLLLLGILFAAFVPFIEQSRRHEKERRRDRLLMLEYPELVSKLTLLLGAGMTLQGAIRKIAYTYQEKRERHLTEELPVYEELLITCREIENGMGEGMAYERLGNRCGRVEYRKLGNMLAQNLRKGSCGILSLLEQEAERAYEERKGMARRCGEEAGTKLLFPMMLMLGLIIVVLMVPAVLAFQ